jgi:hypothetical protein
VLIVGLDGRVQQVRTHNCLMPATEPHASTEKASPLRTRPATPRLPRVAGAAVPAWRRVYVRRRQPFLLQAARGQGRQGQEVCMHRRRVPRGPALCADRVSNTRPLGSRGRAPR